MLRTVICTTSSSLPRPGKLPAASYTPDSARLSWSGWDKKNFSSLCIKTQLTFAMQHLCSAHVKLRIVLSSKNKSRSHKSRHALSKLKGLQHCPEPKSWQIPPLWFKKIKNPLRTTAVLQTSNAVWISCWHLNKKTRWRRFNSFKKSKGDFHYRQRRLSPYRAPHWFCTLHACSFMILWF